MTRDQWLEARRTGIGGSDAAAMMGDDEYKTPLSVYLDKLNLAPEQEDREQMKVGRYLEQYVAERFSEETGLKVRRHNAIMRGAGEYSFMLANPDRLIVGERAGLECKTTCRFIEGELDMGVVPLTYQWQCIHYMLVSGLPVWYLAVLVNNRKLEIFKLELKDYERQAAALVAAEREFWFEHVLKEVMPPPSGKKADNDIIKQLTGESPYGADEPADLHSLKDQLDMLPLLKREKDTSEERYEAARQAVRLALNGHSLGYCDGWRVTDKEQDDNRLNTKLLRDQQPELYNQYLKHNTKRVLLIKSDKRGA